MAVNGLSFVTPRAKLVTVVNSDNTLASPMHPGEARRAVKTGAAEILLRDPFTIRLALQVAGLPAGNQADRDTDLGLWPGDNMTKSARTSDTAHSLSSPAPSGSDLAPHIYPSTTPVMEKPWKKMLPSEKARWLTEFFKTDRDNVWLKSTSDMQVVLTIKDGKDILPIKPIPPGDPILITQQVDYGLLRKGTGDLRDFIMKGLIKIFSQEEAETYFTKKAAKLGVDAAELMAKAEKRSADPVAAAGMRVESNEVRQTPVADTDTPEAHGRGFNPVLTKDVVKPKVMTLCKRGSASQPKDLRLPARELQEEFEAIEDSLTEDDLSYIIANVNSKGDYKTVRDWAESRLASEE